MKRSQLVRMGALAVALACFGLLLGTAGAQKKEKTRKATTKQLMKGLMLYHCGALGKALKAKEANWEDIALRAAMLNEGGYLLMDDGRCPSAEWAAATKAIRENSAKILAQAEKKDLAGCQATFKMLTGQGCAVCHKKHK